MRSVYNTQHTHTHVHTSRVRRVRWNWLICPCPCTCTCCWCVYIYTCIRCLHVGVFGRDGWHGTSKDTRQPRVDGGGGREVVTVCVCGLWLGALLKTYRIVGQKLYALCHYIMRVYIKQRAHMCADNDGFDDCGGFVGVRRPHTFINHSEWIHLRDTLMWSIHIHTDTQLHTHMHMHIQCIVSIVYGPGRVMCGFRDTMFVYAFCMCEALTMSLPTVAPRCVCDVRVCVCNEGYT